MRTALTLLAGVALLATAGCCSAWNYCGQSWDWYKPCDLVEGKGRHPCDVCPPPCHQPGDVVWRTEAVSASECEPAAAPEGPPAAEAVTEGQPALPPEEGLPPPAVEVMPPGP